MDEENILCFSGAEEGIFCALHTICEPGDHVITFKPAYQSSSEIPKLRGCEVTELILSEENNWYIDLDEIKKAIRPNTKCVIINFPHNPTGQIIREDELKELIEILDKQGIWLFSDEVFRLLGNPKEVWASPAAILYPKALSLGVISKAYGMAGLRAGWIVIQDKQLLQKYCI